MAGLAGLVTRLGEHVIGLRTRVDAGEKDRYGNTVYVDSDTEHDGCLVTPGRSSEDEANVAARVSGAQLLAPPGTPLAAADAIIWPISSSALVNGRLELTGRLWEIGGDVGDWDECLEAKLTRMSEVSGAQR